MTILVSGATGNVGGALVRALVTAGAPVRAVIRDDRSAEVLPQGVQSVVGDLNDPQSLVDSYEGVSGLFLLSGYRGMEGILADAAAAGAKRVVLLSASSVLATDTDNAMSAYHLAAEAAVKASGMEWTLLRPNSFMSNALRWNSQLRAGDLVRAQFPELAISMIDPRDIAAVAVRAFETGGNQAYRLTGPQALTPERQVEILARVLDRPLRFYGMTLEESRADLAATMPAPYASAIEGFFGRGVTDETTVTTTVEEVTGRPPRSFEDWARDHVDSFARPTR